MLRKLVESLELIMNSRISGRRYLRKIPLIDSKYERRGLQEKA